MPAGKATNRTLRTKVLKSNFMSDVEYISDENIDASIHTKVMLRTSWGIILVCLGWLGLSFYLNEPGIAILTGPALLGTIIAAVLTYSGKPLLARSIWTAMGIFVFSLSNFKIHPAGDPELMYIVMIGGPFLTFAIGRENLHLAVAVAATIISLCAVLVLGNDYFGPPWIGEAVAKKYLASGTLIMVVLLICMEMATFGILAHGTQKRLEASRKEARRASRAKTDFLAAMSHEIRTPMNGVVGMAEILENSELTAEQSRMVETIRDSSIALLTIIEDILDLSRIEAGKLSLTLQQTEILKVFEKSADTLRPFAEAHNVTLSMCFDPRLPKFMNCDPGRLRQITLNLLANAIKFSKRSPEDPSGQVFLYLRLTEQGDLELVVSDDGIGIAPEFLADLFDPFEQSAEVRRHDFGGSGLGLTIVAQLVEKFGGSIDVESELGHGTTFTVQLPIDDPAGQINLPDLSGKTVACFQDSDHGAANLQKCVECCNGEFKIYETKEDLISAAQVKNDNVVYIVPFALNRLQDDSSPVGPTAWNFHPGTKTIFMSRSQIHLAEQNMQDHIVLMSSPVLTSALCEALVQIFDLKTAHGYIPQLEASQSNSSNSDAPAIRILAAEDNKINQLVLTAQLKELGHSAAVVDDGAKAYELWKQGDFDLILTDCQMPNVDGFELLAMIREEEAAQHTGPIPIIAITANALRGEGERCLSLGMDAYLTKPTTLGELENTLNKHFEKAKTAL